MGIDVGEGMDNESRNSVLTDPLAGMLGYELRRTSAAVMAALSEALASLGLRPSEASLLTIIAENPGCNQSDIGRTLRVQPANLVPLVAKLEAAGCLERAPAEGRAIALRLTSHGSELAEKVRQTFVAHEARIARRLTAPTMRQVIQALRTVCKDACCQDSPDEIDPR